MKQTFEKLLTDLVAQKVIAEDKKTAILTEFDSKIRERDETIFKKALETVDESHAKQLKDKMEKLDEEHSAAFDKIMKKVDAEHSKKLKQTITQLDEKCSKTLVDVVKKMKSKSINEGLVNKISDYFDAYIKETVPTKNIIDESRIAKLESMYRNMRELLLVNDSYIQKEIKEAVNDAKKQLLEKDKSINQLMLEKVTLVKEAKSKESKELLDEKCKDMTPKMKAYIETSFKNADTKEIEERLDEAVKAFKEDETKVREKLVSKADQKRKITNPVITEENVITENVEQIDPEMDQYANILNKSYKSTKWRPN